MSAKASAYSFLREEPEASVNISQSAFQSLLRRMEELELAVMELQRRNDTTDISSPNPVDVLRESCRDRNIPISGDGYVREADAARLVNRSAHTLRNWRQQHCPLAFRRLGNRVEYSLDVISEFLVCQNPTEPDWR
ncbi:hypothetical protein [Phyllobacterium chamaecytisi]|uniref:hypothetical protein n=1 Tax=Phyllobacterium chamaecytisi TaxID=2876082 RepID=UPI001CC971AA|nr:hypothetical protein [Phyllobacterium sp. KW56]MBZ9604268.1 hypothetical protein [Phyllobacterium sp. KW56]